MVVVDAGSNSLGRLDLFQFLEAIINKMPNTGVFLAQTLPQISRPGLSRCCLPLVKETQTRRKCATSVHFFFPGKSAKY